MMDEVLRTYPSAHEKYEAFVDKFKTKKTTDDCYTPQNVYNAVAKWCCEEYGIKEEDIVRPFYPGGDYEKFPYTERSVVVDNPPFSILSQIIGFYQGKKIHFFLFAPTFTIMSYLRNNCICTIIIKEDIIFENGAKINISFLSNMERDVILRTNKKLKNIIKYENNKNDTIKKSFPKYIYPDNIITFNKVSMIDGEKDLVIYKKDAVFISVLDAQKKHGKSIYGGGLLCSSKVAEYIVNNKQEAKCIEWKLSDREKKIVARLDGEPVEDDQYSLLDEGEK